MKTGAIVFETDNFIIDAHPAPFVSREEGGHVRIIPKVAVVDRTQLSTTLAKELMKLTMAVGVALPKAMKKQGIEIGRINYQDMGNWGATLHIHIFGRAVTATVQKYGEAVYLPQRDTGFYDAFKPLTDQDITLIQEELTAVLNTEKYLNF